MSKKYVVVDNFSECEIDRIGGCGINVWKIRDEVIRQFESGIVDYNGNPTAYININGVNIDIKYAINKMKPWESCYKAVSSFGNILTGNDLIQFDYYYLTNTFELI